MTARPMLSLFYFMQETFQQYKRNENIPEFSNGNVDEDLGELQSVNVKDDRKNRLSDEDD